MRKMEQADGAGNRKSSTKMLLRRWGLLLCSGLAGGFCVLFYGAIVWKENTVWFSLGYLGLALALGGLGPAWLRRVQAALHGAGVFGIGAILLLIFAGGGRYEPVTGSYAKSLYGAPNKVMVIVPHEDDDLNLAGGVIDSYRAAGTQVKVVFLSNGDYHFKNAYRLIEAIRSLKALGVPEEDVVFLGYGDQYNSDCGSIYNAPVGKVISSYAGYTGTYGLKTHPAYRSLVLGRDALYSKEDALADMEYLLEQERPDVIYCVDQDTHADHRAASLLFEEAMGNLLNRMKDYRPRVYKGFAYSTAWRQVDDYYSVNVASTRMPYDGDYMEEVNCYRWKDRVRLPVRAEDLAYTQRASAMYGSFAGYGSQKALKHFGQIVNGDKVFWLRRTGSLLYHADFSADTTEKLAALHDFKLADSEHIAVKDYRPFDGVWVPLTGETLKIRLQQPKELKELVLYDNPSETDNILEAKITLDNGYETFAGPLDRSGGATQISLPSAPAVSELQVTILKTQGNRAGLCEVEAYGGQEQTEEPGYIKLTDGAGNFLYTYTPENQDEITFQIYASSDSLKREAEKPGENFVLTVNGKEVKAEGGGFRIPCPTQKLRVRLALKSDPAVYDEIVVKPYSSWRLNSLPLLQKLDQISSSFTLWTRYHLSHLEAMLQKVMGNL